MVTEEEKENIIKDYDDEIEREKIIEDHKKVLKEKEDIAKMVTEDHRVIANKIAGNKRKIFIYLSLALIFISIGMYNKNSIWYILAVVLIILVLFRKFYERLLLKWHIK